MEFMGCWGTEAFSGNAPNYYQQAEEESKNIFKKWNVHNEIEYWYLWAFPNSKCQEEDKDILKTSEQ